jgi:uncharacterized membrane protein
MRAGHAATALFLTGLVVAVGVGLLFAPFLLNFRPPHPAEGGMIKLVAAVNRSSPFEFITHWGLLALYPAIAVWIAARARRARSSRAAGWALALAVIATGFVLLPLWQGWIAVLSAAAVVVLSGVLLSRHLPPISRLVCGLMLLFCAVVWFCELFYVDDVFEGSIERINTVFKAYYGLWPMMAVATVLALRLLVHTRACCSRAGWSHRRRTLLLVAPLLIAGGPYIVLGSIHRVTSATRLGHWDPPADTPNLRPPAPLFEPKARAKSVEEALDGMRYLAYTHPDDYAVMLWIRANLPPDATLLEAAGSQYVYSGRISTMTGRPSFAGWLNHALGWRGSAFQNEQLRRYRVAGDMYLEPNLATVKDMLTAEKIDYVIVGRQEREQYLGMDEARFARLGEKVYSHGDTAVYKITKND